MDISIIICTCNNEDIISSCLDSVKKQEFSNFETFVVDDNSRDRTKNIIRKEYPWVKLMEKYKDPGPAISRNLAAKKAKGRYLVFMDSDVILEKDWLRKQKSLMEDNPQIGIAGGLLIYENRKVNAAGGWISRLGFASDLGRDERISAHRTSRYVPYVCSAACIMQASLFRKIGGFDCDFFYPYEDTDICWRTLIAGKKVYYNDKAKAIHACGHTTRHMSERVAFHVTKNRLSSMLKNYSLTNILLYCPPHAAIILLYSLKKPRLAKLRGIFWPLTNIKRILKKRKEVQKTRKIKDKDIVKLFSWSIR